MYNIPQIFKHLRKWLCITLVLLIGWQQWVTFSLYQERLLHPIQFLKQNYGNDYISQYGKRFEEVNKYFTKPTLMQYFGETNEDQSAGIFHYYLTQYFLPPNVILNHNIDCDTIIYNLYNSKKFNTTTNSHIKNGWRLVKDFNNGIIILAK